MNALISAILARSRTVILFFLFVLLIGVSTLFSIPKENSPDISIPNVYVTITHEGISPEDADQLLFKPLESELKSIDGLKELVSTAGLGMLAISLEFYTDIDIQQALDDVKEKIDRVKSDLPKDSDEPIIKEINMALFPVILVSLVGDVEPDWLYRSADELKDHIEALPGVLSVKIRGKREPVADVVLDPASISHYQLVLSDVIERIKVNHQLISAGYIQQSSGRFSIKVPGLLESPEDILNLPLAVKEDRVLRLSDVASIQMTYKEAEDIAYMNGQPAVVLEVTKRIGANIIDTLDQVKGLIERAKPQLPDGVSIEVSQDESVQIRHMLTDLFNNVLLAILMVLMLVLGSLGIRNAFLIGLVIPGAFLMGILFLNLMGYTLNMVVLFALILSIGLLVDNGIVVTEYADRQLQRGLSVFDSYKTATQSMAWPIISSTLTTLVVFLPLLFWPGVTGEFMKFLPITLLVTLSASLLMSLIVVPTVGVVIGKKRIVSSSVSDHSVPDNSMTAYYISVLRVAIKHPIKVIAMVICCLLAVIWIYGRLGQGVEFFPDVDAERLMVDVRARGNLSLQEKNDFVQQVEQRLLSMSEFDSVYRAVFHKPSHQSAKDLIGRVQVELIDWKSRRKSADILREIEHRVSGIPGIIVETGKEQSGPASGAAIQLELIASNVQNLSAALKQADRMFRDDPLLKDIRDDFLEEGVDWELTVDPYEAARYHTNTATVGAMVQLVTNGLRIGSYRSQHTVDEVDIRLRYPEKNRSLMQLEKIHIYTQKGNVPLSSFVEITPVNKVSEMTRTNGELRVMLTAGLEEGVNTNKQISKLKEQLDEIDWSDDIRYRFRGDFERMQQTGAFLGKAFLMALFLMLLILVTQFNRFYDAFIIMSAVGLSIVGVLMGLLLKGEAFGIVMSGMGVIALAGIVVNNNIVLIDTYRRFKKEHMPPVDAVIRTGADRFRPVLLTAMTTILGLLPMVFQWNIDFIHREVTVGAPSSQWWTQLSTAIAGGLAFSTLLTLILTPCLLILGERFSRSH